MKRVISEYEFEIKRCGKKQTVQQSETSKKNAEKRIKDHIKGIESIKFIKKLIYPHYEGGKRAK